MPDPLVFGGDPRWDRTNEHQSQKDI
jgi:hypothetical protein